MPDAVCQVESKLQRARRGLWLQARAAEESTWKREMEIRALTASVLEAKGMTGGSLLQRCVAAGCLPGQAEQGPEARSR
jgi:hypothetical protein